MQGTAGVGALTAETDLSFSDILDNLEFGFMGTYRASTDRYSITVDAIYMGLGVTEKGPGGALKADIDMDQVGLEGDFGYALSDRFTVLAGLRYVDLEMQVEVAGPLGNERSSRGAAELGGPGDWRARYSWPFADQWSLNLRGDIGGFGVGSDFAWQAIATLRWQFSPRTGVRPGLPLSRHGLRGRQGRRPLHVRHGHVGPGDGRHFHLLSDVTAGRSMERPHAEHHAHDRKQPDREQQQRDDQRQRQRKPGLAVDEPVAVSSACAGARSSTMNFTW